MQNRAMGYQFLQLLPSASILPNNQGAIPQLPLSLPLFPLPYSFPPLHSPPAAKRRLAAPLKPASGSGERYPADIDFGVF